MQLRANARRESRDPGADEDLVQEALLAAILVGRTDFESPDTLRWVIGTVRNQARMAARGATRRRKREAQWHDYSQANESSDQTETAAFLAGLPKSLKAVAALTLSGHTRHEIAYLLRLSDTALRQRIVALKRKTVEAGLALPTDLPGLNLDIAYGRIRDALLPKLLRSGGSFASHDPDGHLFVVRRSQNADARQQVMQLKKGELLDELQTDKC